MLDPTPDPRHPLFRKWLDLVRTKIIHYQFGQVTLSSGTAAVTFPFAENDTSYYISLAGDTAETFTWASKATTGFTINSSNGSSTATVDWSIGRN